MQTGWEVEKEHAGRLKYKHAELSCRRFSVWSLLLFFWSFTQFGIPSKRLFSCEAEQTAHFAKWMSTYQDECRPHSCKLVHCKMSESLLSLHVYWPSCVWVSLRMISVPKYAFDNGNREASIEEVWPDQLITYCTFQTEATARRGLQLMMISIIISSADSFLFAV